MADCVKLDRKERTELSPSTGLGRVRWTICAILFVATTISYLHSKRAAFGSLSLTAAAHQGLSANLFTTASDMYPRSAVGSVKGIGGVAGPAAVVLLASFAGYVLQLTHSYASLFAIAANAYLLALFIMVLLAPELIKVEFAA
jgi:ACS family hexuronate transporter-like MFS transporter